jgi:hypothetical protein
MAFRIEASVIRGEIDNRVKGLVRGKLWVTGRADPVLLELQGNAWPDLAGCLLTFTNPLKPVPHAHLDSLHSDQRGRIGDLTASRKVRVFDVPMAEAMAMYERREKPPEHLANSLYLEWYSERNGRVVIESADYELVISAPEWRLTPAEEAERAQQAEAGMANFMQQLDDVMERHRRGRKDPEETWDEHDYEQFLRESDARTKKYGELLDKYGDSPDAEAKIDQEMGWTREDDDDDARMSAEEINALCEAAANEPPPEPEPDPQTEGIDWIRTAEGEIRHPLQHRCFESAVTYARRFLAPEAPSNSDPDLIQFVTEFQITGVKLAGALYHVAEGDCVMDPAFTVACLKRALGHLHQSQAGLEAITAKALLPPATLTEARQELFAIREGILALMDRYRGR